jgi:hypothetical protein
VVSSVALFVPPYFCTAGSSMMKAFPTEFVLQLFQIFPAVTTEARRPSDVVWNGAFLQTLTGQLVYDFSCQIAWLRHEYSCWWQSGTETGPTWGRSSREQNSRVFRKVM